VYTRLSLRVIEGEGSFADKVNFGGLVLCELTERTGVDGVSDDMFLLTK
jgi:hypothetical protein